MLNYAQKLRINLACIEVTFQGCFINALLWFLSLAYLSQEHDLHDRCFLLYLDLNNNIVRFPFKQTFFDLKIDYNIFCEKYKPY